MEDNGNYTFSSVPAGEEVELAEIETSWTQVLGTEFKQKDDRGISALIPDYSSDMTPEKLEEWRAFLAKPYPTAHPKITLLRYFIQNRNFIAAMTLVTKWYHLLTLIDEVGGDFYKRIFQDTFEVFKDRREQVFFKVDEYQNAGFFLSNLIDILHKKLKVHGTEEELGCFLKESLIGLVDAVPLSVFKTVFALFPDLLMGYLDETQQEYKKLKSDLQKATRRGETQKSVIESLQASVKAQEAALEQVKKIESEASDLNDKVTELAAEKATLQESLSAERAENKTLRRELEQKNKEIDSKIAKQRESIQKLASTSQANAQEIQTLKGLLHTQQEGFAEKLISMTAHFRKAVEEKNQEIAALAAEIEQLREAQELAQGFASENKVLQAEVVAVKAEHERLTGAHQALVTQDAEQAKIIQVQLAEIASLRSQLEAARLEASSAKAALAQAKRESMQLLMMERAFEACPELSKGTIQSTECSLKEEPSLPMDEAYRDLVLDLYRHMQESKLPGTLLVRGSQVDPDCRIRSDLDLTFLVSDESQDHLQKGLAAYFKGKEFTASKPFKGSQNFSHVSGLSIDCSFKAQGVKSVRQNIVEMAHTSMMTSKSYVLEILSLSGNALLHRRPLARFLKVAVKFDPASEENIYVAADQIAQLLKALTQNAAHESGRRGYQPLDSHTPGVVKWILNHPNEPKSQLGFYLCASRGWPSSVLRPYFHRLLTEPRFAQAFMTEPLASSEECLMTQMIFGSAEKGPAIDWSRVTLGDRFDDYFINVLQQYTCHPSLRLTESQLDQVEALLMVIVSYQNKLLQESMFSRLQYIDLEGNPKNFCFRKMLLKAQVKPSGVPADSSQYAHALRPAIRILQRPTQERDSSAHSHNG